MHLLNYYWYFTKALPVGLCNKILKLGKSKKAKQAGVGENKKDQLLNKQEMETLKVKRNSKVVWLDEPWIYKIIQPFVNTANRNAGWNFEWDWSEPAQFTQYKKGMYYNWHIDSLDEPYINEGPLQGKIRKLTSVLVLSNTSEYKGGELEFQFQAEDPQFNKSRKIRIANEVAPK